MSDSIISKKNQLIDLVQGIVNEYTIINEVKIQNSCETDLELRRLSDILREQERHSNEMVKKHSELENEIQKQKKQLYEYEELIKKCEDKIVTLNDTKEEGNKFNIVRIQAKEIEEKDREIDRLNKKIVYLKEGKKENKTIDIVLQKVEEKIEGNDKITVEEEHVAVEEEHVAVEEEHVVVEEEHVAVEEEHVSVEEEHVAVEEEHVAVEEVLIKFTYRNKSYYYVEGGANFTAYHCLSDETKGDIAGEWGQTKTGKKKLLKK